MQSWLFFLTLVADALYITVILDFELLVQLSPKLSYLLAKLSSSGFTWAPDSLSEKSEIPQHHSSSDCDKAVAKQTADSSCIDKAGKTLSSRSKFPKYQLRSFPRAPVAKGSSCLTHQGSLTNCATFFDHQDYEYKLLDRGQLYFRRKGTDAYRPATRVPEQPGQLFLVNLGSSGSDDEVVVFCFDMNSRLLGEIDGHARFLPVKTRCLVMSPQGNPTFVEGQGCVFDWVYANNSMIGPPASDLDYERRYDAGWLLSSPADEQLLDTVFSNYCCPSDCFSSHHNNPLRGSMEGILEVEMPLGIDTEVPVYGVQIEWNDTLPGQSTQPPAVPSVPPTLPVPLVASPPAIAGPSTGPPNRSVIRRTCDICGRIMRRPSALKIHMNAHQGIKPFKCGDCTYSSTNVTNFHRHRNARHGGASAGDN